MQMATTNEVMLDRQIRHQIYLQQYSVNVIRRMMALLNRADADIIAELEKRLGRLAELGFDTGPASTKRLRDLLNEVRALNKAAYDLVGKELTGELRDFAAYETEWQTSLLAEGVKGATVAAPAARTVAAAAMARPFQGALLSEWLDKADATKSARVRDAVRIGLVEGQTVQQMVRRIRGAKALGYSDGLLEIDRRGAEALVRTAVSHTASVAREEVFEQNSDLLAAERWTSVLDGRTTPICRARDGKRYPVGKGPRPPAHIGCRSMRVAVLLDKFAHLGDGATRASATGQVDAELTYQDWLNRQTPALQDEILGAKKAAIFRTGGLPLDRFVDNKGKELTLAQLQQKEPVAFKKAGLANPIKPPRGVPQDEIAKFLASKPDQQALLKGLYGSEYRSEMGVVGRVRATEGWKATEESIGAVRYYTGNGYAPINRRMREGSWTLQDRQFTALAVDGLEGMGTVDRPILRAPTTKPENAQKWWDRAVPGEAIDLGEQLQSFSASPAFVSTWARGSDVLLRVKQRRPGAYIEKITQNPGEHEVLLPPGLKYRVAGKTTESMNGREFRVIDLEIDDSE